MHLTKFYQCIIIIAKCVHFYGKLLKPDKSVRFKKVFQIRATKWHHLVTFQTHSDPLTINCCTIRFFYAINTL